MKKMDYNDNKCYEFLKLFGEMGDKQNGVKILVIIGVVLSAFLSAYFGSHAWTEAEFCSENLICRNLDTDRPNMDGLKSIASPNSQPVSRGLGHLFFLPFFLFQIPPYKKAFALRC